MPREFAADNTAYGWRQSARDRLAYLAFAGSLLNRFISSRVLLLLALCSMAAPVAAEEDFVAAGILLASQNQQPTMIFLVKHHSRLFYEMPGGRRQLISSPKGERRETAYETAIRECIEETRGHLSASLLQERVDPSRYLRDHGFVFFFGKIHRFTLSELGELSNSGGDSDPGFREVADYAWVALENVFASVDGTAIDAIGRRIVLRRELKSRLERAQAAGWL